MELLLRRKCGTSSSSSYSSPRRRFSSPSSSFSSSSVDRGSGKKWIGTSFSSSSYSSSPVSGYVSRTESGLLSTAGAGHSVQTRIRRRTRRRRRRTKTATKEQPKTTRRRSNSDMNSDDVSDERTRNKTALFEEAEEEAEVEEEGEGEEEEEEEEEDEKEEEETKRECEGVVKSKNDHPSNQRDQKRDTSLDEDSFGLDRFCGKLRLYADSVIEAQSKLSDLLQDLASSSVLVVDCCRSRSEEDKTKKPPPHQPRSQVSRPAADAADAAAAAADAGGRDSFVGDFDESSSSPPEKCYSASDGDGVDCNDDTSRLDDDDDDDDDDDGLKDNVDVVHRIQTDADLMNFKHRSQNERKTEGRISGESSASSTASLPPLLMATAGQQQQRLSSSEPSPRGDDRKWFYEGVFVAPLLAEQLLWRTKQKNSEMMTSAQPENNNNDNSIRSKFIGEDFTLKKRIKIDDFPGGSPPPPCDLSVLKTNSILHRTEDGARTGGGGGGGGENALRRTFEGFEPDKAGNYDPEAVRERYLSAEATLARLTTILGDRRKSKSYIDAKIESLKRELSHLEATFFSEKARLVRAKRSSEYQRHGAAAAVDATAFDYRGTGRTRSGVAYEPLDPPRRTTGCLDGASDDGRDEARKWRPQTLTVERNSSSSSYGDRPRETALELVTKRPLPVSQVVAVATGENPGLVDARDDDPQRNRNHQMARIISNASTEDPRKNVSGQLQENGPLCLTSRPPANEATMSETRHAKTPPLSSCAAADSGSWTDVSRHADDVTAAKSSPSDLSPPNCAAVSNGARLSSTENQTNRPNSQRKRTRDNCDANGAIEVRRQSTVKTDSAAVVRPPEISGKSPLLLFHHLSGPGNAVFRREATRATYGSGVLVGEGLRTMAFLPPAAGSIGAPLTSNSLLLTSSSTSSSPSFDVCLSKYGVSERRDDPDPSLLSDPAHVVVARATAGNLYSAHPPNGYHHRHHQQRRIVSYGQNSREPDVVYGVGGPYDDRRWVNAADPRPREAVALQSPLYHHPHLTLPAGVRNPLSTEHPGIRHFQDLRHRTLLLNGSGPMAVGNVPLQYPSKDHLDLILTYQGSRRGILPPPPPPTFGNCADFRDPGYQGYLSRGMSIAMPPGNAASRLIGYRPCLSEPIVFPQRDGTLW